MDRFGSDFKLFSSKVLKPLKKQTRRHSTWSPSPWTETDSDFVDASTVSS